MKDQSGVDNDIVFLGNTRLIATITLYRPTVLCFNGKRAAREGLGRSVDYGWQSDNIGPTRVFVAPSTSGAARRW